MIKHTLRFADRTDADLVADTLNGGPDAFRHIVERYQTLVCSIAYSATGSVSRSEDVAQETFLTAWRQLPTLREPEKLRSWLCGIVRNHAHRAWRGEQNQPVRNATPLEEAHDTPAPEPMPTEQAVTREEQAILWRSLERIPQLYREPLILYYREHKSIEHVAAALELSEDAVKQRLSRGRKLLQEEVQSFVESTLRRTAPGPAFSNAVLAMFPMAAGPVATGGMGVATKATLAKSGLPGVSLLPLAPFLGIAAGVGAQCLLARDLTPDRQVRTKRNVQIIVGWILYIALAAGGESAVHALARHMAWGDRMWFTAAIVYWWLFVMATITVQILWLHRIHTQNTARREPRQNLSAATPMKPGVLAGVLVGVHLAMFSWLVTLALRHADYMGACITLGAMVTLCLWGFLQFRARAGGALALLQGAGGHVATTGGIILLIVNLRAEAWAASAYGVSVALAHRVVPLWIIPALTVVLVAWTALLLVLTTSRGRDSWGRGGAA